MNSVRLGDFERFRDFELLGDYERLGDFELLGDYERGELGPSAGYVLILCCETVPYIFVTRSLLSP